MRVSRFHPHALVALALISLTACAGKTVSSARLADEVQAGNPPAIIDVRTATEFEAGHVPGAVNIPFHTLWRRDTQIPVGKSDEVVVYCEHGPRASLARFGLESLGFERVRSLDGHMKQWRAAGFPLLTGPGDSGETGAH